MGETPEDAKQRIIEYYQATTEESYIPNWAGDSLGFHFGLADDSTRSLSESLLNSNVYLAERAGIEPGMRVLDAGCGIGGSAIWLAQRRQARVTGITLVARQVELARQFAVERGVDQLVTFEERDMVATGFGEASFDIVWNLESMCHVVDLAAYLEHVAHLLRDGGRFACIDLCSGAIRDPAVERPVCDGWALAALRTPQEIVDELERLGFKNIEMIDLTPRAMKSAQALEAMASRSLLKIRAEQTFLGNHSPTYEGHVRAALAMVEGMRTNRAAVTHFLANRSARY